jgi:hypothetical protein
MTTPDDEKETTATAASAAQAEAAERETAGSTATPQVEPPDEHSPDGPVTRG